MNEVEWLTCTDPEKMMKFLWKSENITDRKRRLFGVAVCRRIWNHLAHERSRTAVEVAEKYADVPADQLRTILRSGARLFIPLVWMDEMKAVTCDVGSVGFEFFSQDQPPAVLRMGKCKGRRLEQNQIDVSPSCIGRHLLPIPDARRTHRTH